MKVGRPSGYTTDIGKAIVSDIRRGMTQATAAERAGVHPVTLSKWKKSFPEFGLAIGQALAEFGSGLVNTALSISSNDEHPKQWEAVKYLLESRFPNDSPRIKKLVSEAMDSFFLSLKEAVANLPEETQDQILEAIEHARESTLAGARHSATSREEAESDTSPGTH